MYEQVYSVNGIELYSLLNPNLNSFCLSLYIRAGSLFEAPCENGISHLFEHAAIRNLKSKYENFYELLATHGLDLQGYTYKEFIRFTINGPDCEFGYAAEILCSLFDEISLSSFEFNNEKKRIKAEIREKDERSSLDCFFNKLVWQGSEAEKTVLGYCRVIDGISLKKINAFRRKILSRGNCFVYVTGNVSDAGLVELKHSLETLDINGTGSGFSNSVTQGENFFNRNSVAAVKNDYWHYVKIGFDIDCSKHHGGVLDLLYAVLFKGEKALVYNFLSEENPIIYSYDSTLEQYDNIGNICFKFAVDPTKLEEAVGVVVDVLNAVKNGRFNFQANINAEMSYCRMEADRPDDLNWSMAYYNHILKTDRVDYSDKNYGRYKSVTKEQVIAAAKEIFRNGNMVVAIKGDKRNIKVKNIDDILKNLD